MKDNHWKPCEVCGKGHYTETTFNDDMDGVLHCNKCGYSVKRYPDEVVRVSRKPPGLRTIVVECCNTCENRGLTGYSCCKYDYEIDRYTMVCESYEKEK